MKDHRTIVDVFLETCKVNSSARAFTCMGRTLSYADVDRLSKRFAAYLQQSGLVPGDRIAVQLPNILQYPIVVFGAIRAGIIVVNTNPLYTSRELKHQLTDSGAKALVVLANVSAAAAEIVPDTSVEQVIITELGDLHRPLKRGLINFVVRHVKHLVPNVHFEHSVSLLTCLDTDSKYFTPVEMAPSDLAVLQYTGGTTGVAKGAMLSHHNLVSNMMQVNEHLAEAFNPGHDSFIAPLPLYHIYAFTIHCMCAFSLGSHSVLIPNPRDIPSFVDTLKHSDFTAFIGLNTLFNALCHNNEFKQLDFSQLTLSCSGGMALTHDVTELWQQVTGCKISEGYGLTETSPVVCINPYSAIRPGTLGTALPNTQLRVCNNEGQVLALGQAGELCVKGPQVMQGYWQREKETCDILSDDGWLRTGDVAKIDEEGYVTIVDRQKDVIIVSGFNVYPNEIEDVLSDHPMVLEVAAVGVQDVVVGEQVKVFVVLEPESEPLSEVDIKEYCRHHLTSYKVPKFIEFRDELPKTNVGKVLRRELKES